MSRIKARTKAKRKRRCEDVLGKEVCDRIVELRKKGYTIWQTAVCTDSSEYYVRKVLRERGMTVTRRRA